MENRMEHTKENAEKILQIFDNIEITPTKLNEEGLKRARAVTELATELAKKYDVLSVSNVDTISTEGLIWHLQMEVANNVILLSGDERMDCPLALFRSMIEQSDDFKVSILSDKRFELDFAVDVWDCEIEEK